VLDPIERGGERESAPAWMRKALHDLCQPLTALECQLYLAMLDMESEGQRGVAQQRATIEFGMHECSRMMAVIRTMQERMAADEQVGNRNCGGAEA
jgi:hypothetical protein